MVRSPTHDGADLDLKEERKVSREPCGRGSVEDE